MQTATSLQSSVQTLNITDTGSNSTTLALKLTLLNTTLETLWNSTFSYQVYLYTPGSLTTTCSSNSFTFTGTGTPLNIQSISTCQTGFSNIKTHYFPDTTSTSSLLQCLTSLLTVSFF